MDLQKTIGFVRTLEKELALFNVDPSDPIVEELTAFFETQNVRITGNRTPPGTPSEIAVLGARSEVHTIVDLALLRELITHSPVSPDEVGVVDTEYEAVLGHLKETTFTSYDHERMFYASREIENRAHRVGYGTIHAGFQRCSIMNRQQPTYRALAQRGLDVHVYGVPDATPPDIDRGQVHTSETTEIAATWFVVFDGAGDDTQKSALVAEEQAEDNFYGVWTYDPVIVDRALDHLERTYVVTGDTRSCSGA
ncbi:DICT sensory domain-containing protein [Haloplanus salilacus]|uniref:DICT sensory domain-containing protein n=1 Tax=Haloplanus salilacus TaxID=2949994 RepID=UPI0030D5F767